MSHPVLELSEVTFRRQGKEILHGIDLTVRAGEHWALLGPNGAGKSTILGFCGAQAHPTSGTVDVLGHRLGRVDVERCVCRGEACVDADPSIDRSARGNRAARACAETARHEENAIMRRKAQRSHAHADEHCMPATCSEIWGWQRAGRPRVWRSLRTELS